MANVAWMLRKGNGRLVLGASIFADRDQDKNRTTVFRGGKANE